MKRGRTYSWTSSSRSLSLFRFVASQNATCCGAGRRGPNDWILCQVTSNPYGDEKAIAITEKDFQNGSLRVTSYARPGKLFTANASLIAETAGALKKAKIRKLVDSVIEILQKGI